MKFILLLALVLAATTSFAKGYQRDVVIESMNTEKDGNIYSYAVWIDASGNHLGLKGAGYKESAVGYIQYRLVPATNEIEQDLTRNSHLTVKGSLLNKELIGKNVVETILVREITKD